MTILQDILKHKAQEVATRKKNKSEQDIQIEANKRTIDPGLMAALRQSIKNNGWAVIAEIKRASPSQGLIRSDFDPEAIAKSYQQAGAAALSVLTDEVFFQGRDEFLLQAHQVSTLPCLRKEFIIDTWQVYETKALGAAGLLLIVAALQPQQLQVLYDTALKVGLDVLVEVHDERELEQALALQATLIGINNRNLHTFETSLAVSASLAKQVPAGCLVVSESGISTEEDVNFLQNAGINAFLMGESFMRAADPGAKMKQIFTNASNR